MAVAKNKIRVLHYIFKSCWPFKRLLFMHLFVVIFQAIDTSLWPYISKLLVDSIAGSSKENIWDETKFLVVIFIFLTILPGLIWRITDFSWSRLIPKMRQKIAVDACTEMLKKSYDFFNKNPSGSLTNRVKDLSQNTTRLLETILYSFLTIFLSIVVAFYTLWHVHKFFALGLFVWAFVFIYLAIKALELTARMSDDVTTSHAKAIGNIVDIFSNIQNVKFYSNEDEEIKRVSSNFAQYGRFFKIRGIFLVRFYTLHGLLFSLYFTIAVFGLLYLYSRGTITLGDFVLIFTINSWMINQMWRMASQLQKFSEDFGAVDQSLRILAKQIKVKDIEGARDLKVKSKKGPKIDINDLKFSYSKISSVEDDEKDNDLIAINSDLVIKNLHIKSGQKIGLVGASGSGKSTFINLLMRSYDVDSGEILIDDQNVAKITQKSLRKQISLVPQEPLLFHRSVYNNIRYARLNASNEEIEEALKMAYCTQFVKRLSRGYDTIVGDRGSRISGGQKQRLSIARAFLENGKLLIMDESTSNLDIVTEQLVHRGLLKLMRHKTVIIAAHKLGTLKELDRILVFNRGKIAEDGTHESLLKKKNGHYRKMWEKQSTELLDIAND